MYWRPGVASAGAVGSGSHKAARKAAMDASGIQMAVDAAEARAAVAHELLVAMVSTGSASAGC